MSETRLGTGEQQARPEIDQALQDLWFKMPAIARHLIPTHLDMSVPANRRFYRSPNAVEEHKPDWHQWGIITHSQKFGEAISDSEQIPAHLQQWGLKGRVDQVMAQRIDGVPKADLLHLVASLHDLGKFTHRQLKKNRYLMLTGYNFIGHEAASGDVVGSSPVRQILEGHDLTPAQIEYLARGSEIHFELGKLRDRAKNSPGYNFQFVESPEFQTAAFGVMHGHPDMQLEIGLLFLADSLAKTDIRISTTTDEQIVEQLPLIRQALAQRNMNPKLEDAVAQLPINLAAAKRYLELWGRTRSLLLGTT